MAIEDQKFSETVVHLCHPTAAYLHEQVQAVVALAAVRLAREQHAQIGDRDGEAGNQLIGRRHEGQQRGQRQLVQHVNHLKEPVVLVVAVKEETVLGAHLVTRRERERKRRISRFDVVMWHGNSRHEFHA
jgi:hypothetical protein